MGRGRPVFVPSSGKDVAAVTSSEVEMIFKPTAFLVAILSIPMPGRPAAAAPGIAAIELDLAESGVNKVAIADIRSGRTARPTSDLPPRHP